MVEIERLVVVGLGSASRFARIALSISLAPLHGRLRLGGNGFPSRSDRPGKRFGFFSLLGRPDTNGGKIEPGIVGCDLCRCIGRGCSEAEQSDE
jgi:hypothetical protein